MRYPYLVLSDTHYHAWSQFAHVDGGGLNSRLRTQINETEIAFQRLRDHGGTRVIHCGDVFHNRGSIQPDVFNPVYRLFADNDDLFFYIVPGNHDLRSNHSEWLHNSTSALAELPHVFIAHEPTFINQTNLLVPWQPSSDRFKTLIAQSLHDNSLPNTVDVFCHVGIDGVLPNMPDHGLAPSFFENHQFHRVFAGHYHHHKRMGENRNIISVGPLTHQSFADVGADAGSLIVWEDDVEFFPSQAPAFVDLTPDVDEEGWLDLVSGNYVRVREFVMTEADVRDMRAFLTDECFAAGVVFQVPKKTVTRRATSNRQTVTLEQSVDAYIDDTLSDHDSRDSIRNEAHKILSEVQSNPE